MPFAHIWRSVVRSSSVQGTEMTCFMLAGMAAVPYAVISGDGWTPRHDPPLTRGCNRAKPRGTGWQ
jgi:D-aminopeptidase